jgi:hypothetical protein
VDDVAHVLSTLVDEIRLLAVDARDEPTGFVSDVKRHLLPSLSHLARAATIPAVDLGGGAA